MVPSDHYIAVHQVNSDLAIYMKKNVCYFVDSLVNPQHSANSLSPFMIILEPLFEKHYCTVSKLYSALFQCKSHMAIIFIAISIMNSISVLRDTDTAPRLLI